MVKRILALSLLMVGLAGCGSGGGASAEADTLNTTPATTCMCTVTNNMYIIYQTLHNDYNLIQVDTTLCKTGNLFFGCQSYPELCTSIDPSWKNDMPNVWLYCTN